MRLFPIKVHCWGGFGSQLYALTLSIDLKKRFPSRDLVLYFHDGGVTQRPPEILGISTDFDHKVISDFSLNPESKNGMGRIHQLKFILRRISTILLKISGLLSSVNGDKEFRRLKPWVYSIRGHYSYRTQNKSTIEQVYSRIASLNQEKMQVPNLAVHYRLGDLTDLETKQPVSSNQIAKQIFLRNLKQSDVVLFSDSVDKAQKLLADLGCNVNIGTGDSIQTVLKIVESKEFIGTSSKISYWAVIFRTIFNDSRSSILPISDKRQIEMNLGVSKSTRISFY